MDKLSSFVHEQIKSGVKTADIKYHLLQNGWKEKDVNDALDIATGRRLRHRIFIAIVGILIVGILALSLVTLAKNPKPDLPLINPNSNTPGNVLTPVVPAANDCSRTDTSIEKDECYKQKIKAGYDCKILTDEIEIVYCHRAYEDTVLLGVDEVKET